MSKILAPTSKALGSNPKDILGAKKIDTTLIPAVALAWEALAMMDGAGKYDPYNWRANKVVARIYVAAAKRHLDLWLEGQEEAEDSGCHHLGHARACCGILLDAQTTGNLIDDRPVVDDSPILYAQEIDYISSKIPSMQERHRKFRAEQEAKKAPLTVPVPNLGVGGISNCVGIGSNCGYPLSNDIPF